MTFAWPEYINVAEDLLNVKKPTASDEAIVRAAVSRAYYAAHRVAHYQLTGKRGMQLPNTPGGVHERVIQALFMVNDATWKQAGISLDGLRRLRVQADYDLPLPNGWGGDERALRNKAVFVVLQAKMLLSSLEALP